MVLHTTYYHYKSRQDCICFTQLVCVLIVRRLSGRKRGGTKSSFTTCRRYLTSSYFPAARKRGQQRRCNDGDDEDETRVQSLSPSSLDLSLDLLLYSEEESQSLSSSLTRCWCCCWWCAISSVLIWLSPAFGSTTTRLR